MMEFEACVSLLEMLLDAENAALSRIDVETVTALAAEKHRLVDRLRELRPAVTEEQVSSALSAQLRRLSRACDDNKALLERAMLVHRRLMSLVIAATRPPVTGYGRRGVAIAGSPKQARAMIARA